MQPPPRNTTTRFPPSLPDGYGPRTGASHQGSIAEGGTSRAPLGAEEATTTRPPLPAAVRFSFRATISGRRGGTPSAAATSPRAATVVTPATLRFEEASGSCGYPTNTPGSVAAGPNLGWQAAGKDRTTLVCGGCALVGDGVDGVDAPVPPD